MMEKKDAIKITKTSGGDGINLIKEIDIRIQTDSKILMNYKEKYYYQQVNTKNNQHEEVRLSNFIIEPRYVIEEDDKRVRYILEFISENYSKIIEMDGETLATINSFKRFCMSYGKFNWRGNQSQLDNLAEFIMNNAVKDLTIIPYSGFHPHEKIWIFPTHAYYKGNIFYLVEDKVFKINNKYYKLGLEEDDEYTIYPPIMASPTKDSIAKFFSNLKKLYGNYFYLTFGYIVSSFHADTISNKTNNFPFMYVYGKQSSGKTALMSLFSKFSGMKALLTNPPSLDGLRKGISKRSNVPFVIDE